MSAEKLHHDQPEKFGESDHESYDDNKAEKPVHHHEKPVEQLESLEHIRKKVESQAETNEEAREKISHSEKPKDDSPPPSQLSKQQMLNTALARVRRHLPARQKLLSEFMHQPVVDAVSEVTAKYILRPTCVLCGGIFAFVGSLSLLIMAKHYGFKYNYLMFLLFFVGGFIVGIAVELLVYLAYLRKKH